MLENLPISISSKRAYVDEAAGHGGRRSHSGTHEMSAAPDALTSLEIAVRCRSAALTRVKPIVVHGHAHGAASIAPLETGIQKDAIEALSLGLRAHAGRAWHDDRRD